MGEKYPGAQQKLSQLLFVVLNVCFLSKPQTTYIYLKHVQVFEFMLSHIRICKTRNDKKLP